VAKRFEEFFSLNDKSLEYLDEAAETLENKIQNINKKFEFYSKQLEKEKSDLEYENKLLQEGLSAGKDVETYGAKIFNN
jgi:chaperonin cofactor prefoldin